MLIKEFNAKLNAGSERSAMFRAFKVLSAVKSPLSLGFDERDIAPGWPPWDDGH